LATPSHEDSTYPLSAKDNKKEFVVDTDKSVKFFTGFSSSREQYCIQQLHWRKKRRNPTRSSPVLTFIIENIHMCTGNLTNELTSGTNLVRLSLRGWIG
jgi:hypothetical protein